MKILDTINYNHHYFDKKIKVFEFNESESPNGKYLVKDLRENIQFYFSGKLDFDVYNNDSFFDDLFFEKISNQNSSELDPLDKKDMFYIDTLFSQLERIINHCMYTYKEFGAEPDQDEEGITYPVNINQSLITGQDPIHYNGKVIKDNDFNIID